VKKRQPATSKSTGVSAMDLVLRKYNVAPPVERAPLCLVAIFKVERKELELELVMLTKNAFFLDTDSVPV